jgi:hypothetical protein
MKCQICMPMNANHKHYGTRILLCGKDAVAKVVLRVPGRYDHPFPVCEEHLEVYRDDDRYKVLSLGRGDK